MTGEAPRPQPKPVKRKKPRKALVRTRMKRRPSKRVKAKTAGEKRFLAWLHRRQCAAIGFRYGSFVHRHEGWWTYDVEAAHFRDHTGVGRCEPYSTCVPLCKFMHDNYDGRDHEVFKGWTLEQKKAWHRGLQAATQAAWSRA